MVYRSDLVVGLALATAFLVAATLSCRFLKVLSGLEHGIITKLSTSSIVILEISLLTFCSFLVCLDILWLRGGDRCQRKKQELMVS